jgi:hypothetical protein
MSNPKLTTKDLKVIFDVLNVYDPKDIEHVYPEMGKKEFTNGVKEAWKKVFAILRESK